MINISILIQRMRWHQRESSICIDSYVSSIDCVSRVVRERLCGGWRDWMALVKVVVAVRQIWTLYKLYLGWGCISGVSMCSVVRREKEMGFEGRMLKICARFGRFGVGVVLDLV